MFSIGPDDTYCYQFGNFPVTIVVANDGHPLSDSDLRSLLPHATAYGMNAIVNAIRLRERRALVAPYNLLCNVLKDDVDTRAIVRAMGFYPNSYGPGFVIARPSRHKQVPFTISNFEAPEPVSGSALDLSVTKIVDKCKDTPLFMEGELFKTWLSSTYRHRVNEVASIFGTQSNASNHIELSAGVSVLQPLARMAGSYVQSNDIDKDVCDIAASIGHDVSHRNNYNAIKSILPDDVVWACRATNDSPMLPMRLVELFPHNTIIIVADTAFIGRENYRQLSNKSNIYVRNFFIVENLAKRLCASTYVSVDLLNPNALYFLGDDYARDMVCHNKSTIETCRVCAYDSRGLSDIMKVVPIRYDAIDVYHDIPNTEFYKHFYLPYGVLYTDSVAAINLDTVQYVMYGATVFYDQSWHVEGLPRNNVIFHETRLIVYTPSGRHEVQLIVLVPCMDSAIIISELCFSPYDQQLIVTGVRMTDDQMALSCFRDWQN